MKKLMSIALFMALMASLLAGCGRSAPAPSTPSEPSTSTTEPNNPSAPAGDPAASFPEKEVTIVVPFAAGGVTDLVTRVIAEVLSDKWNQSVVVENIPGGSSLTGIGEVVYNREADGTNIVCNSATVMITKYTTDTFIDISDFTPLCKVTDSFCTLTIRKDLPYDSLNDFFDEVRANPGKYTMAVSGAKSIWYALGKELEEVCDLEFTYVPYDGGAEAAAAVAGGICDVCMIDVATILSLYQAGEIKVIGYFGDERNSLIPEAETAIEVGYDLTLTSFFGFLVPNGVDQAVLDKLSESVKQAMEDERVVQFLEENCVGTVNGYIPQDEYYDFMMGLDAKYSEFFVE